MYRYLFIVLSCILLSGCSTKNNHSYAHKVRQTQVSTPQPIQPTAPQNPNSTYAQNWIIQALWREYKKWEGTPYKLGGNSKDGVDCSSFIQNIYVGAFNILLPRTTQEQQKFGFSIDRSEAREGDLLFFKTGTHTYHTGVFFRNGRFIHASTTKGVSIAELDNPYWKNRYLQTRRLLPR